jgi:uncharacterized protein
MGASGFRERLAWDGEAGALRDGAIRYLMIRPDALMGIFKRLSEAARREALAAFAESIYENGGKSAAAYRALSGAEGRALLDVIAATAPQLGWGIWQFDLRADGGLDLVVRNSPFVEGFGPAAVPICAPVVGMFRVVSQMVLGAPTAVEETACGCQGHAACHFVARLD